MGHESAGFSRRFLGTTLALSLSLLCPLAVAGPKTVPLDESSAPPFLTPAERAAALSLDEAEDASSRQDALVAAVLARHQGEFPLTDHVVVRKALTRLVATSTARRSLGAALDNRREWASTVDRALAAAGVPPELAAIPVLESGYTNARLPAASAPQGMWAFLAPTARAFGLRVDSEHDDRMDPQRASDAAARYLASLHGTFGDWGLAVAAYNRGGGAVAGVVRSAGTSDVFTLIERGALPDYAARVVAVALVMAEPELLREPQE